jgi:NTE family protein
MVFINATDMSLGTRLTFHQTLFNAICSDLSSYSVARACAASSAVPGIMTPVTLKNYTGTCGYKVPSEYEKHPPSYRQKEMRENLTILLDGTKKPYFHLIDGGVADNLGLRAVEEAVDAMGNFWTAMKILRSENVRKVVFIVVNAETKIESKWDKLEIVPPLMAMVSNYSSIAIVRYNRETMALLQESFMRWTNDVRTGRCPPGGVSTDPGACGDIEFYLMDVKFDQHKDPAEREYLGKLPTSFRLSAEAVDRLKKAARSILTESADYQRLIRDLNQTGTNPPN